MDLLLQTETYARHVNKVHENCIFKHIIDEFNGKLTRKECGICFKEKYDFLFTTLPCCKLKCFCTDCIVSCSTCPICRKDNF